MTSTWYSKAETDTRHSGIFYVEDYGAKGDGVLVTDVATNGTNTFTSATMSASASVGQWVMINGGRGTSDTSAIGTITGISGTSVTIDTTARSLPINATASGLNAIFGTDDTTAINNCVAAAASYAYAHNYSAEVRFRDRAYVVSGNTQTTNTNETYNAQIPIPYPAGNNGRKLVIAFKGATRVDHFDYWNATIPAIAGTTIVSTQTGPDPVDATYGPQSVFGAPIPGTGDHGVISATFINHKPVFENIQVVMPLFTNLTGFDFSNSSGVHVDGCTAKAFAQALEGNGAVLNGVWASFGAQVGTGMRLPITGNNADNFVPSFAVEGLNIGLIASSEHVLIGVYKAIYMGVVLQVADSTVGHGLSIQHVTAEAYQGGIVASNGSTAKAYLNIESWSTEDSGSAYDIHDTGNCLYGYVKFYDAADSARAPVVNSAANLRITNEIIPRGAATAPSVPATTVNLQNPFWRDAAVNITGGTVTAIKVDGTTTNLTSGTVIVPTGKNISITYSSAPTWVWTLL